MFAGFLIFVIFGALIGWFAKYALEIRMSRKGAMVVGALGAVIGGGLGAFVLPLVTDLFAAVCGACLAVWFVERWRNRVV
jgi:hypothetical protein